MENIVASAKTNTAHGNPIEQSPGVNSTVVPRTSLLKRVLLLGVFLWLFSAFGIILALYWIYGTDTHHDNLSSIWWPTAATDLIPPTATDITLRQDHLDHDATYTVSRVELQKFLKERFIDEGASPQFDGNGQFVEPRMVGKTVGPLGWVVTKDTIHLGYTERKGTFHDFYHDVKTGSTYQDSAYW
jgi:hypothetical protein